MVGLSEVTKWPKSTRRPKCDINKKKLNIHVISDGITRLPILDGEISQIELPRCDRKVLGMTIVGGSDTPLRCIVIQEVFHDGLILQDGRLQPGDQIVEIDGKDMTSATHREVFDALKKGSPVLKLGIYREKIEYCSALPGSSLGIGHNFDRRYYATHLNNSSLIQTYQGTKRDFQLIKLRKTGNQKMGLILMRNQSSNEFQISEIIPNSAADNEVRLDINDCVISINGEDAHHYDVSVINDLLENLEHEVHLVVRKVQDINTSSPIDYKINMLDDSDRKTWSTCSISDRISELSCADDPTIFSDDISEYSRSSYDAKSVSDIVTDSGIFCHAKSSEEEAYTCHEPSFINESIRKQPPTIYSPPCTKQNNSVANITNVLFRRKSSQKNVEPRIVVLRKKEDEGLGMRIGGGLNSNEGDTPIYVANINSVGPAGRSHQIKKGDILISVNDQLLLGLTHSQAVSFLKLTSNLNTVSLTIFRGSETAKGAENFVPSWLFWQKLPKPLHISKSVILHRGPGASLGFSIVGGNDSQRGPEPIYVLFVVAASPAAIEGKLRSGDKLLAVDGHSLESVPHAVAVSMLKHAGNRVILEIVSWLGTEI